MEVTFYQFTKRKNSTKIVNVEGSVVNFVYKQITDTHNPIIQINKWNNTWNYAKIGMNYYFVDSVSHITKDVYEVALTLDLLATYKTEILATDAFVIYSENNYNKHLLDNRLSSDANVIMQQSYTDVSGFPSNGGIGSGCFALTVLGYLDGDVPKHGTATVTYFLSATQMHKVVVSLMSPNALGLIEQYFKNPFDAIVECYWLPFDISTFTNLVNANVSIAGVSLTDTEGNPIVGEVSYLPPTNLQGNSFTLDIPWVYDDFRNLPPYTTMNLFLPCIGDVALDSTTFYSETSLFIEYTMDWLTGSLMYDIRKGSSPHESVLGRYSTNVKTLIPIGQQQSPIGKLSQAFASIALGSEFGFMSRKMYPAMLTSFVGANSVLLQRDEIKQNGGYSGTFLNGQIGPKKAVLTIRANNTSDEPTNLANVIGRPCYKKLNLSLCTGYVQTQNVSIAISGFEREMIIINNMLNGGVYIE